MIFNSSYLLILLYRIIAVEAQKSPKVYEGPKVPTSENFPYVFQLWSDKVFRCGCSAVHEKFAITSATCVYGITDTELEVNSGSKNRNQASHNYKVSRVYTHHKFDSVKTDYDIAVLELQENMEWISERKRVSLPTEEPEVGTTAMLAGWGVNTMYDNNKQIAELLRYGIIHICPLTRLAEELEITPTDRMLCGGCPNDTQNARECDGGGPLLLFNNSVQIGIVSFGYYEDDVNKPVGYTNLANPEILSFIKSFLN